MQSLVQIKRSVLTLRAGAAAVCVLEVAADLAAAALSAPRSLFCSLCSGSAFAAALVAAALSSSVDRALFLPTAVCDDVEDGAPDAPLAGCSVPGRIAAGLLALGAALAFTALCAAPA
jgi:hypothetical protein